ncbi:ribosomal RNA small subunit methyltransferase A [Candidatus Micrarchaeota archaeon]|nr:ribosomal RNA small subunit methyltransferase A [Candidatus Micrarchaeota archaeon]MBD3417703.1 ribosomal RNA small subunit methyltransferase A [Candidatus Micrarchaeota archaeon]
MKLKKSLGQHFLSSPSLLEFEATLANPKGKDVIEIGPGDGRLTEKLLEKKPASLTVIEKDSRWAESLKEKFGERVTVIEGDILKQKGLSADVIVGNLPYYISSPIIFSLAMMPFKSAILMVQLEFAKRMVAEPKTSEYGRLSVTSQLLFQPKLVKKVKKGSFTPPPKVDSAIILLKRKDFDMDPFQERIIRILFQHKNQLVRNALKHGGIETDAKLPKKRARELSKEDILVLTETIRASLPS